MLELNTCEDAENAAQSLQIHFLGSRELSRCIPPDFITRALMLVLYLLPHMQPCTEDYVRTKLDMFEAPILSQAVQEVMLKRVPAIGRYSVLELDLRAVVILLRDAQTLTSAQLQYIGALLQPLWDHYQSKLELERFLLQSGRTTR